MRPTIRYTSGVQGYGESHDEYLDRLIREAGWYPGTMADWNRLSMDERRELAFAGTGCEVAVATWEAPVDCVHVECQIRRGERPAIALTNATLRSEMARGYLRFGSRKSRAARCRIIRSEAHATGIYDPWKMANGWQVMVSAIFD
jgi:hypothetical protein